MTGGILAPMIAGFVCFGVGAYLSAASGTPIEAITYYI